MEEIADIGKVSEDDVNTDDTISGSEVAGVLSFDDFNACIICKSKVQQTDEKTGVCSGCKMVQKIHLCKKQMRAKLLLTRPGGNYITLNAFGSHLLEICEATDPTQDNLLAARPFNLTHKNQVINSISR